MKRILKFFAYFITAFSSPGRLARAVNEADTPDEMDELVLGGFRRGNN